MKRRAAPFSAAVHRWRTEGDTPAREAVAIGCGIFIGCTPLFGLHLPISIAVGWFLGLNRMKIYLGANLPNPFVWPALLFGEVQVGAWLRRGRTYPLDFHTFRTIDAWSFGGDLLLGALILGSGLGLAGAALTYRLLRRTPAESEIATLLEKTSDRYLQCGVFQWEFARAKLRTDPVYTRILAHGWLPDGGTILDLGCGRGFMLALLATARRQAADGVWPAAWPPPPMCARLVGIDRRVDTTTVARHALEDDARIITGDLTTEQLERSRAVLLFDVLQMIDRPGQEALLRRIRSALEDGGTLLIREAVRNAGWRFQVTRLGNRCTALWRRAWRQRFHYRSLDEWTQLLSRSGFEVATHSMSMGTPFANVLLAARRRSPSES